MVTCILESLICQPPEQVGMAGPQASKQAKLRLWPLAAAPRAGWGRGTGPLLPTVGLWVNLSNYTGVITG